jgi:transposase
VGVDDWAWRKGQSFGTILVDLERREVVDLLPTRSAKVLAEWLAQHPEVKVVSRDRQGVYAEGVRAGAPGARQVADRFHLTLNLRQALERELAVRRSFLRLTPKSTQEHTRGSDWWRHGNREQGEADLNPIQRAATTRRSRPTPAAAKARVVSNDPAHEERWHEGEPNRAPSRHQSAPH